MMKMKKLTASAIAAGMMLTMAGPAFAAANQANRPANPAQKMRELGVIKGDEKGNLNLDSTITRAELVTTIVRSFGRENAAVASHGRASFGDVKGNDWHSGWVAEAKKLAAERGVSIGTGANTFHPLGKVSAIEALVFVMKFMGITVEAQPGVVWYEPWVATAVELGIVTEAEAEAITATAGTAATRGAAFELLDKGFSTKDEMGNTLYMAFIDTEAPVLTATVPATTTEATITVAGTVSDNKGVAAVTVNDLEVEVEEGAFSVEVELAEGANEITVAVTDTAGHVTTETYAVERTEAPVEEAPVEEAPVEEAPVEEAPADETGAAEPVAAEPVVAEPVAE